MGVAAIREYTIARYPTFPVLKCILIPVLRALPTMYRRFAQTQLERVQQHMLALRLLDGPETGSIQVL